MNWTQNRGEDNKFIDRLPWVVSARHVVVSQFLQYGELELQSCLKVLISFPNDDSNTPNHNRCTKII